MIDSFHNRKKQKEGVFDVAQWREDNAVPEKKRELISARSLGVILMVMTVGVTSLFAYNSRQEKQIQISILSNVFVEGPSELRGTMSATQIKRCPQNKICP